MEEIIQHFEKVKPERNKDPKEGLLDGTMSMWVPPQFGLICMWSNNTPDWMNSYWYKRVGLIADNPS